MARFGFAATLLSLLLVACGMPDDSGIGAGAEFGDLDADAFGQAPEGDATEPELHEDVLLVEDDPCLVEVMVSEDREILVFDFACDPIGRGLEPGRIVVGVSGGGYLRRVESIALDGYTVTAWTSPADLAEALVEGGFSQVVVGSQERALINLGNTTLYSGEVGPASVSATLTSGYIDVDPVFVVDGHWADGEVQHFDVDLGLSMTGDINAMLSSTNGLRFGHNVDLYGTSYPFAFAIGPLPVVGTVDLKVKAGFRIDAPGHVSMTVGAGGSFDLRTQKTYRAGEGWTENDVSDSEWTLREPDFDVTSHASGRVYIRLETGISLYGIAGPQVATDAFVSARLDPTCEGIDWDLNAGVSSRATIRLNILDKFKPTKTFAKVTFTADLADGTITWPIDTPVPCAQPTISCGDTVTEDSSLGYEAQLDGYDCNVGNYDAPEVIFEWTASQTGLATWGLENAVPTEVNHDVFVLDGAWGLVTAQCMEWGHNSVDFDAVAGQTYYLVVDGYDNDAGLFTANLECDGSSSDDDTLNPF